MFRKLEEAFALFSLLTVQPKLQSNVCSALSVKPESSQCESARYPSLGVSQQKAYIILKRDSHKPRCAHKLSPQFRVARGPRGIVVLGFLVYVHRRPQDHISSHLGCYSMLRKCAFRATLEIVLTLPLVKMPTDQVQSSFFWVRWLL